MNNTYSFKLENKYKRGTENKMKQNNIKLTLRPSNISNESYHKVKHFHEQHTIYERFYSMIEKRKEAKKKEKRKKEKSKTKRGGRGKE